MLPVASPSWMPAFEAYLALLDRWNQTHALTALPPELRFEELILDALALVPHLKELGEGARVVDFGSGMGSPALPLAVARPDLHVIAVDASAKKVAFLKQVILELRLPNVEALHGRIETLAPLGAHAGTAKAVGTLGLLAGWWQRHGLAGASFYAFKGPEGLAEAMPLEWERQVRPYRLPSRGERCLIEMKAPPKGR